EMLERLAEESGIATPTAEDLIRLDRKRKGKRLSNAEWASPSDPEARIAKLKDGRPHLAYEPEHAVDLDTGAIVAAEVHAADRGDTAALPGTLEAAEANLAAVGAAPTPEDPAELVADKGYHSRDGLKDRDERACCTRPMIDLASVEHERDRPTGGGDRGGAGAAAAAAAQDAAQEVGAFGGDDAERAQRQPDGSGGGAAAAGRAHRHALPMDR